MKRYYCGGRIRRKKG